jgi:hypothetical protein
VAEPYAPSGTFVSAFHPAQALMRPRWRGQPGRIEVWYSTLTDPETGTGLWLHHELVAPADGGVAYTHGWAALFPPEERPEIARFGPYPWQGPTEPEVFTAGPVGVATHRLTGTAGGVSWDLWVDGGGDPLYPFPAWAWRRELLPAAQVVPMPAARFTGTVHTAGSTLELKDVPGCTARVYGHGNARRWAWLHADLGDGDVCEVVTAVSNRPGMRRLRPLSFVRLRVRGIDLPPGDPLRNASRFQADITLPTWTVRGRFGPWRLTVEVAQPADRTLAVDYTDPDGSPAVCHNTERADATITIAYRDEVRRRWRLDGTAHAELGERDPSSAPFR